MTTPATWRNALHKVIVGIGFLALTVIVSGAQGNARLEDLTLRELRFDWRPRTPAPFILKECRTELEVDSSPSPLKRTCGSFSPQAKINAIENSNNKGGLK